MAVRIVWGGNLPPSERDEQREKLQRQLVADKDLLVHLTQVLRDAKEGKTPALPKELLGKLDVKRIIGMLGLMKQLVREQAEEYKRRGGLILGNRDPQDTGGGGSR